LSERLRAAKVPKTAATIWCGAGSAASTASQKVNAFQSLIRQHYEIERVVFYDNDDSVLNAAYAFLKSRGSPRSYSLYRIENGTPIVAYGSAVYVKPEPSEF
jgi:hypothetical protein